MSIFKISVKSFGELLILLTIVLQLTACKTMKEVQQTVFESLAGQKDAKSKNTGSISSKAGTPAQPASTANSKQENQRAEQKESGDKLSHAKTGKAWESYEYQFKQVGDLKVRMHKLGHRNLPPNSFDAFTSTQGTGVLGDFKGACAQSMAFDVKAIDTRKIDFSKFKTSQKGQDLPSDVHKVINAIRIALQDQ